MLNYTNEMYIWTKQETIAASYHPAYQHDHTNVKYVSLLERVYSYYYDCSYNVWYVYTEWPEPTWSNNRNCKNMFVFQPKK